jgi:tetratricopeptide (TPR) repeat protein
MLGFGFNKDKTRANAERFVQQGKLQNAIAEYDKILKTDPKDLTILNTVGDLYSRLGQTEKAIHCFKQVGDTYAADGFVPKAIAMYKKLTKLNPSAYDSIQKLGELYTQQGLYNDARAQFLLAVDGLMRGGQAEEAAGILRRLLEVDPDNAGVQTKLADIYLKQGKREEAKAILLSAAESMCQRNAIDAAAEILNRLLTIDKDNSRARMLQGQILLEKGDAAGAIKALESLPNIDSRPEGLRALLKAYISTGKYDEAEPVARKLHGVHHDISGIASVAEKVVVSDPIRGLKFYEEFGDTLIAASPTNVVASLRGLVSKVQDSVDSLEILLKLFQRAGDTSQNSEIYEMIAHACVQSGEETQLRRAAQLYKELAVLEPENPLHAQNYRQILTKLGDDPTMIESPISDSERPFALEHTANDTLSSSPAAAEISLEGMTTAELLEKRAEDGVDSDDGEFSRATHRKSEDSEPKVTTFEIAPEVPAEPVQGFEASSLQGSTTEFAIPETTGFVASSAAAEEVHDLSDEWEKHVSDPGVALVDPTSAGSSDAGEHFHATAQPIPDLIEEIKFYTSQQMWDEAKGGLEKLAEVAPTNEHLSELRNELATAQVPKVETPVAEAGNDSGSIKTFDIAASAAVVEHSQPEAFPVEVAQHASAPEPPAKSDLLGEFVSDLETSLGDDFALGKAVATPSPTPVPTSVMQPAAMTAAASITPTHIPSSAPITAPAPPLPAEPSKDAGLLDDLFDEFKQEMGETSDNTIEDPDTHYNLGVAFKEMGLLDESIGELQKVCQAIDRGTPFSQTMQAYTWLAHCFVEKGVPEASFMWFERALSVANDNDTRAAILYELGSAYEMADQRDKAKEAFTKVMSINIDFRDVGERIKALKS